METIATQKFFLLQFLENQLLDLGMGLALADLVTFVLACLLLGLLVWMLDLVGTRLLAGIIRTAVKHTKTHWDDYLLRRNFFSRFINLLIGGVLAASIRVIFTGYAPSVINISETLINIFMVVMGAMIVGSFLEVTNDIYNDRPQAKQKSIKSFIQTAKIIIYVITGIIVLAIILRKDPTQLLVGLGASAAIMTLVFKDTILGFVASIQISAQDMIRPGDWIEMPSKGADGVVMDINVSNVKVRNWNNTITMIPIYSLVSDSFTNWRNMEESAGRRFKRPVLIDLYSVREVSEEQLAQICALAWVAPCAETMLRLNRENNTSPFNTNIGLFRCYVEAYLRHHPKVVHTQPLVVRYLPEDENGITIELYGFSAEKEFQNFEPMVCDLLNHIMHASGAFGLNLYQRPMAAPQQPAELP